jgi:Glycosyl hydrolase family 99
MRTSRRPAIGLVTAAAIAIAVATDPVAAAAPPARAAAAAAPSARLRPTADATVTVSRRSPLHGRRAARLRVDSARRHGALLRFDLRHVAGPLASARLVLTVAGRARGRVVALRVDAGPWNEHRGRLGRRLRTAGEPARATLTGRTRRLTLDVSGLVAAGRPVTIAVLPLRGTRLAVWSREHRRRAPVLRTTGAGARTPAPPPVAAPAPAPAPLPASGDVQPALPVRAAFYYPWYPETWTVGGKPVHENPTLGRYATLGVIDRHLDALAYAHIQVAIASWWGPGTITDQRLPALLDATRGRGDPLRWAAYYEPESTGDPSVAQIRSDISYLVARAGHDPAFFRIAGRPVIFVFTDGADGCPMAERWKAATAPLGVYVVLKVFAGYQSCPAQPDAWHQYAPAGAEHAVAGSSFSVSPGFWKADETTPRLGRDLARWRGDIQAMVASRAPFQLITTFNEWGEGTATESASEWASPSGFGEYLDALHEIG